MNKALSYKLDEVHRDFPHGSSWVWGTRRRQEPGNVKVLNINDEPRVTLPGVTRKRADKAWGGQEDVLPSTPGSTSEHLKFHTAQP